MNRDGVIIWSEECTYRRLKRGTRGWCVLPSGWRNVPLGKSRGSARGLGYHLVGGVTFRKVKGGTWGVTVRSEECDLKKINGRHKGLGLPFGGRSVTPKESIPVHGASVSICSEECTRRGVERGTRGVTI